MWTAVHWLRSTLWRGGGGDDDGARTNGGVARVPPARHSDAPSAAVARLALAQRLERIAPRTMLADRRRGRNSVGDAALELCAALVRHVAGDDAFAATPLEAPATLNIIDAVAAAVLCGEYNERIRELHALAERPRTIHDRALVETTAARRRCENAQQREYEARRCALRADIVDAWCALLEDARQRSLRGVDIVARVAQSSRRFVNTRTEFDAWLLQERAEMLQSSHVFAMSTLQFDDDDADNIDAMRRALEPFAQAVAAMRVAVGKDAHISADFFVDVAVGDASPSSQQEQPPSPLPQDEVVEAPLPALRIICQCAYRVRSRQFDNQLGMDVALGGNGVGVELLPAKMQEASGEVTTVNTTWTVAPAPP